MNYFGESLSMNCTRFHSHLKGECCLGGSGDGLAALTDQSQLIEEYSWLLGNAQNADVKTQSEETVDDTSRIMISNRKLK